MIQLLLGLTFFALFVIMVFASCVSVPIYALIARQRWSWAGAYIIVTFLWLWVAQFLLSPDVADSTVSAARIWWNSYWWVASLVFYQSVGVTMGIAVLTQKSPGRIMFGPAFVGAAVLAVATVAVLYYGPLYLGQGVVAFITAELSEVIRQTISYYEAASIPQDRLAMLKAVGDQMTAGLSFELLPSIIWLMSIAATMVTILLGKWFVPRPLWMKYQGGFTRWKAPSVCVWLVIFLGALYFVDLYLVRIEVIFAIVFNGLFVLAGLFLLQGALIVGYYIRRQRDGIFRWIWYGMILLFFQTALIVMIILGLFDYWVDFRRIDRRSTV